MTACASALQDFVVWVEAKGLSAVGFEPTRSKTLRPERNPLDHSGKLTDSPLSKPHITTCRSYSLQHQQPTNNTAHTTLHGAPRCLHTIAQYAHTPTHLRVISLSQPDIFLHHRLQYALESLLLSSILRLSASHQDSRMSSMAVLQKTYTAPSQIRVPD